MSYVLVNKDLLGEILFTRVVRALQEKIDRDAAALRSVTGRNARNVTVTSVTSYKFCETQVLGALAKLWIRADTYLRSDNTMDGSVDEINELVGIAGFCQLLPAKWFKVVDPETVELPDYHENNGTVAKKKSKGAQRQARYRERKRTEEEKHETHKDDVAASRVTLPGDAGASPSLPFPSHIKNKRGSAAPKPVDNGDNSGAPGSANSRKPPGAKETQDQGDADEVERRKRQGQMAAAGASREDIRKAMGERFGS
jgi:hypothetical protein